MKELLDYLENVILPILDRVPANLGEWDWPRITKRLRQLIAKAKGELK